MVVFCPPPSPAPPARCGPNQAVMDDVLLPPPPLGIALGFLETREDQKKDRGKIQREPQPDKVYHRTSRWILMALCCQPACPPVCLFVGVSVHECVRPCAERNIKSMLGRPGFLPVWHCRAELGCSLARPQRHDSVEEEEEELRKALFFLPPLPSVRGRIYIWNSGNSGLHFVTYLYTRMGCHCCLVSPSFPDRVKINAEEKPNLHYIHFKLSANDQG